MTPEILMNRLGIVCNHSFEMVIVTTTQSEVNDLHEHLLQYNGRVIGKRARPEDGTPRYWKCNDSGLPLHRKDKLSFTEIVREKPLAKDKRFKGKLSYLTSRGLLLTVGDFRWRLKAYRGETLAKTLDII